MNEIQFRHEHRQPGVTLEGAAMTKVFIQALEGPPDDLIAFTGKSERDIRVRWLVANETSHGEKGHSMDGPWAKHTDTDDHNGVYLKRSQNWPSGAIGNIDEVHLIYISDGTQFPKEFATGKLHFAPSLTDRVTFDTLSNDPSIAVRSSGNISIFFLAFRLEKIGRALRRQIASAIDVNALADLWSQAATAASAIIPRGMHGHDWGKHEKVQVNPSVPPLTLLCPPQNTFAHDLATNIQRQCVHAKITVALTGTYRNWREMTEAWKQGQGDMVIASWHHRTSQPDDPDRYLNALFHSSGGANWGKYGAVDSILKNKEHEKAVKQIKWDVPIAPLVYWNRFSAYRTGLGLELEAGALPKDRLVNVKI